MSLLTSTESMMVADSLSGIKGYILDMDGTFYLSDKLLPGSLRFMRALASRDIRHLFVTNNSTRDRVYYADKMKRLGINESEENILTSGEATARYIRALGGKTAYIAGTPTLVKEFAAFGLEQTTDNPDYVVIGFDTTLTYDKLWRVCDFVRKGVTYIATHPDLNCPIDSDTGFMPDIGGVIAFVEATTGRLPRVIGKPNEEMMSVALEKLGLDRSQVAVVGDRLYTDIASGINAGLLSILVLTGETRLHDLAASEIKPDIVFENLGELAEALEG